MFITGSGASSSGNTLVFARNPLLFALCQARISGHPAFAPLRVEDYGTLHRSTVESVRIILFRNIDIFGIPRLRGTV